MPSTPKKKIKLKPLPFYTAPEVWSKKCGPKSDIWSVGIILYVLLAGYPPFVGPNQTEIKKKILKGVFDLNDDIWSIVSKDAKDLIKKMIVLDPNKRISAADALKHPWIINKGTVKLASKETAEFTHNALENLKKFHVDSVLKQATLSFIASQVIDERDKNDLLKLFHALDKDGDGKLSKKEVLEGCDKVFGAISPEELEAKFDAIDIDKSGSIDYNEFIMATISSKKLLNEKNIKNAFDLIDKDHSGSITIDEIKDMIGADQDMPDEVFKEIIKEVDTNGDGEINFDEFETMLIKLSLHQ